MSERTPSRTIDCRLVDGCQRCSGGQYVDGSDMHTYLQESRAELKLCICEIERPELRELVHRQMYRSVAVNLD